LVCDSEFAKKFYPRPRASAKNLSNSETARRSSNSTALRSSICAARVPAIVRVRGEAQRGAQVILGICRIGSERFLKQAAATPATNQGA
jgi:hypothetical protein